MSCRGVKVWYNNMTAKTAVFGLQLWERDGRNEKETNAGDIGNAELIAGQCICGRYNNIKS